MASTAENVGGRRPSKEIPPWMRKTRRVLDILATGGMIWLTEPKPGAEPAARR